MKIGICATSLTKERITGIENYVRNLIIELSKIDKKNQYSLYLPDQAYNYPKLPANFKIISSPTKKFWEQRELPKLVNHDNPDVIFIPSNIIPLGLKPKVIYHFHDLAWKYFRSAYSFLDYLRQSLSIARAKKCADFVITASVSAKNDLLRETGYDPKKILVVPLGYDESIAKYASDINQRQGIIYCGRLELKKNLPNILFAYKDYADKTTNPESLFICGSPGHGYPGIAKTINGMIAKGYKIKEMGYLSVEAYYKQLGQSKVLLFPSLYEGFGLPILEAFALKTAVITSNISSMPEISGDAALLVDPFNISTISKAISKLTSDSEFRASLIKAGNERLTHYSWEKTARGILKVFEDVGKA